MQDPKTCKHQNFHTHCGIHTMADTNRFMAEVRIKCTDCDKPFQFLGLEPGLDFKGARVSLDGLELNIAISPEGILPDPLQRMMGANQ